MLDLRPNCECCDRDLPPAAAALICSFECTFCPDCATSVFGGICPNCDGVLTARPIRPAARLGANPPSTRRVLRADQPCLDRRGALAAGA